MGRSRHDAYIRSLPADWSTGNLVELGRVTSGGTPGREVQRFWDGDVPWLTPGELTVHRDKAIESTRDRLTPAGVAASGATVVPQGSLMVTTRATLGSRALAGVPMATNQGFKSLTFGEGSDADFYYHLFELLSDELTRRASGTTFLEISGREFGRVRLPRPPIAEQRRIAEILDTVDDAIRSTEGTLAKAESARAGLALALLSGRQRMPGASSEISALDHRWTIGRLPAATGVPAGWRLVRLREHCRLESGHTPSRAIPSYWGGDVGWVSLHDTADLSVREIEQTTFTVTQAGLDNSSARLLPKGTVALSRTATVGSVVLLGRPMATSQDFACFTPSREVHTPYLLHLFRFMQPEWRRLSAGSTHQTIYMPVFRGLQVLLPPIVEQRWIADCLDGADESTACETRAMNELRKLRTGLADDLLSGRVRTVAA